MSKLIVESRLGSTDCSKCHIYRQGRTLLAVRVREPGQHRSAKFVALPTKIAQLPSEAAAKLAIERIALAIATEKPCVNLTDLEDHGKK